MDIIKITSGLGNQLFQYAFGRARGILNNLEVKYDINHFSEQSFRQLGLTKFKIIEKWADEGEIVALKRISFSPIYWFRNVNLKSQFGIVQKGKHFFIHKPRSVDNYKLAVDPYFNGSYFQGFFLNESYFLNIRDTLLSEITLKDDPSDHFKNILAEIEASNSVSVHVRRGDYLNHRLLNVLSLDYYDKSLGYFKKNEKNPRFFIFSDDKKWVKENLALDGDVTFVDTYDYEELILMSKCKNNIVANSTFSWWGAWLNDNDDKTVIAPKLWYKEKKAQQWYEKSSYIPKSWMKF